MKTKYYASNKGMRSIISIPSSHSFAKLVMMSSALAKSTGDAILASPADVLRGSHSFLPQRRLLNRAVNSFPIVRKYQLESTCQKQKQSYLSLHLTKFHHTCTKIIRKLFSIQGVNYFSRAVKKSSTFFQQTPCRQHSPTT